VRCLNRRGEILVTRIAGGQPLGRSGRPWCQSVRVQRSTGTRRGRVRLSALDVDLGQADLRLRSWSSRPAASLLEESGQQGRRQIFLASVPRRPCGGRGPRHPRPHSRAPQGPLRHGTSLLGEAASCGDRFASMPAPAFKEHRDRRNSQWLGGARARHSWSWHWDRPRIGELARGSRC